MPCPWNEERVIDNDRDANGRFYIDVKCAHCGKERRIFNGTWGMSQWNHRAIDRTAIRLAAREAK